MVWGIIEAPKLETGDEMHFVAFHGSGPRALWDPRNKFMVGIALNI